jgi:hypothetical protein
MFEYLARLGYAAKALVYAIVGVLAILAVSNRGGMVTDTSGALRVVLTKPLGRALLIVVAIGLCGYAVWRVLDALLDPDRDGTSFSGLVTRIGNAVRGCIYGALGLEAIQLLRGLRASNGDAELWTARILEWPSGPVLVGIAGGIVAAYGANQVVKSIRGAGDHKVDWSPISPAMRPFLQKVSRFGVGIRGGVIATLGVFLVRAALTEQPAQAAGTRESMLHLGGVFEGRWLLALIAVGVLAYAVDQAIHARCRRIHPVV